MHNVLVVAGKLIAGVLSYSNLSRIDLAEAVL